MVSELKEIHKETEENTEGNNKTPSKFKWNLMWIKATNTGSYNFTKKRERDLILVYGMMKALEKLDREYLPIWTTSDARGHVKKLRKDNCRRDINKFSFPQDV